MAEIVPSLELVSGVLSQTSYAKKRPPRNGGGAYYKETVEYLSAFRGESAFTRMEEILGNGINDAPFRFAVCLGPLPDLPRIYEYPEDIIDRMGGEQNLETLRVSLAELAKKSDFAGFMKRHEKLYSEWTGTTATNLSVVKPWQENFYGQKRGSFRHVLAPLVTQPGPGGYGGIYKDDMGGTVAMFINRADVDEGGGVVFRSGPALVPLMLHEWGHSFVNPALDACSGQLKLLSPHYDAVAAQMKRQRYGQLDVFVKEQVLRACVIMALRDLQGEGGTEAAIKKEESMGFFLTRPAMLLLEEYRTHREQYPDFDHFAPVLVKRLSRTEIPGQRHSACAQPPGT